MALSLAAAGVNDCEIARRLGVPRTTVRDWRSPRQESGPRITCPRCRRAMKPVRFTPEDYALLLGLYLGDGCISRMGRTYRLRIHLDTKYPEIVAACEALLVRCFPHARVSTLVKDGGSCAVVGVYSNHLPCLFPQHGPGKKHERPIVLEDWQQAIVEAAPWALLKGLIWSDGCCFVNRTGRYEYLSYEFANMSTELVALFSNTCDLVGVAHRHYPPKMIRGSLRRGEVRINRREAVSAVLAHVGRKA